MKGRSQMTSTVFGYDHIMMRAEYRTPDPHSHLAVHFIAGLDGPVHCVVSGDSFDADAVFIASDVVHTAYAETGDMLVFLFDTAGSIAEEAQKQYLCGRPYFCGDKETVEKVTLTTTGKAIEFAVSGSVVDGEDGVVNEPMQWVVTVYKNGKEIEKKSLSFRDGKEIGMDDLNLYYN